MKGWFVVIIILLVLGLFVYAYNNATIFNKFQSAFDSSETNGCKKLASTLIPNNYTLYIGLKGLYPSNWKLVSEGGINSWKDGSEVDAPYFYLIEFIQGSKSGQNVNYYYLNPGTQLTGGERNPLTYERKIVSPDGTVMGTRTFQIEPILKPIPSTEVLIKNELTGEYWKKEMKFEIINPNFVSCHWITDDGRVIE